MGARAIPKPGMVLAERYRLVQTLGQGGMGSVWRAEHQSLDTEVAVKIIDPIIAEMDMGIERFMREARALAKLRSPHIVQVLDFGSDGQIVFLVMELLEGRNLGQRLKEDGKLSPQEALRVLSEVCKGMSHAHARGLVHRDLKPDNIFLCDQSREHLVKVLDFGIAKAMRSDHAGSATTDPGSLLGTPSYMSPEQCRNIKHVDARSDLWALGAIAYECLIGKRAYEGDVFGDLLIRICTEPVPVPSKTGAVPKGFDAWFEKALARNPDDRFQSAAELAESFAVICNERSSIESGDTLLDLTSRKKGGVSVEGTPSTLSNGTVSKSGASPSPSKRASVGVAVIATVLGVLGLVVVLGGDANQPPREQRDPEPVSRILSAAPGVPAERAAARKPEAPPTPSAQAPDAGTLAAPTPPRAAPPAKRVDAKPQRRRQPKPAQPAPLSTPPHSADQIEVLRRKR